MVVLAETVRGNGPRDAPMNMTLAEFAPHRALDEPVVRIAGRLLAATRGSNTIDAIVAAEALADAPTLLYTSDPDDLSRLLAGHSGVVVVAV